MGRFYETSTPTFVSDKMFQLPWELMANTIMNKEKAVDAEIGQVQSFQDKLTAQGLTPDEPRIKEKIAQYENKINDIVNGIKQNPMEYNKFSTSINSLGRDINKDWSMGEISKIESNRKAYIDYSTQLDEAYKKNPDKYSDDQIDLLKKQALKKYSEAGGAKYDAASNAYNQFSGDDALQLGNLADTFNENIGKYIKADSGETATLNTKGQWVIKTHKGEELVSEGKLKEAAIAYVQASPDLVSAIAQRTKLGIKGFEDPLAYIEDNVNAFIQTNQYKKDSITKDVEANPYAIKDYDWAHEKEKEKEDIITYFTDDHIVGTGGRSWNEYTSLRTQINKTIDVTKDRAKTLISDTYGYKNEAEFMKKNPIVWNRLIKGDFIDVLKLPGGKEIANEYKQAKYNLAGQEALKKEYAKNTGKSADADTTAFGKFLETRGTIAVNRTSSWADFGVTTKQIDQVGERWINDGYYLTSTMRFPKGTIMKAKDSNGKPLSVDLGSKPYTLNEMINLGLVEPEPVKVPIIGIKDAAVKGKDGKEITPASYEIQYRLTDGTGNIGFSNSSKTVVPVTSYNDDGKIEMGSIVNFRGKNVEARNSDVQTQSMLDYNTKNAKVLKTKLQLEKWSDAGDVEIPNTGGAVYHSQDIFDKDGKMLYKKGQLTMPIKGDKARTFNTTDPTTLKTLSDWLYD